MTPLAATLPAVAFSALALAQQRWEMLPAAPVPPRYGATMHPVGTDLVVFGGQDTPGGESELRTDGAVFDTKAREWHTLPPSPLGERKWAVVVPVEGGLYVAGGVDRWLERHAEDAVFDVAARAWRPLPAWPIPVRYRPSVAVDGPLVALFGGHVEGHFADGVLVDTRARTVKAIPAGPLSPRSFAAVHLANGKLLVAGGKGGGVDAPRDAAVFDVAEEKWTKVDAPGLRPQPS